MRSLIAVIGWVIYLGIGAWAVSCLFYIWSAARRAGSVTQMGLCQWGMALALLIIFGVKDWNKVHLVWLVPVCLISSFTGPGKTLGYIIGCVTQRIFGRKVSE